VFRELLYCEIIELQVPFVAVLKLYFKQKLIVQESSKTAVTAQIHLEI